jgi:hypothetical protein
MKKRNLFILVLLVVFHSAFAGNNKPKSISDTITVPAVLVIDAEVSVILSPYDSVLSVSSRKPNAADYLRFKCHGDTLTVSAARQKYLLNKVVVYIPASRIREVQIRKFAEVRSAQRLNVPQLIVSLYCLCLFNIINAGDIEITGPYEKETEYTKQVAPLQPVMRRIPMTF